MDFKSTHLSIYDLLRYIVEGKMKLEYKYPQLIRVDESDNNFNPSSFIESILLGIPTPALYFTLDKENFFVIDGLKRLEAIYNFYLGNFKLESHSNLKYSELPRSLQRRFEYTLIQTHILCTDDKDTEKSVFQKLQNKADKYL